MNNKANFGSLVEPFTVRIGFTEQTITLQREALDEEDLREEQTLNAPDRVLLTLMDGRAIADGIAQMARIPLGTVRNALSKVERQGLIEPTGEFRLKSRVFGLTVEGEARTSRFTHHALLRSRE